MDRWAIALKNAPLLLRGIHEYNIASRFGPLPAREWLFPVTYRCDARCVMCNIWQSDKSAELSLEQWSEILNDRLFAGIESVSLTGGEPTLRRDLPQLTELLVAKLPALRRLTLTTNALRTERVIEHCQHLLDLSSARGIHFFVGVSLDGVGQLHDEMRSIAGAFDNVVSTLDQLRDLQPYGLRLGVNCTLTSRNLHDARNLREWCAERGLVVNFIIASFAESFYENVDAQDDLAFSPAQRELLLAFLHELAAERTVTDLAAYFYTDAARMIRHGAARSTPCVFQKDGILLDARGDLHYCMYSRRLGNVGEDGGQDTYCAPANLAHREEIIAQKCPTCTITCFLELALAKDAFKYVRFLLGGRR